MSSNADGGVRAARKPPATADAPSLAPLSPPATDEVAIRVSGLSKCYTIYGQPKDRLKQSILPRLQHLAGKAPRRYYREFWALRDVSFELRKGETVGIIGRNGAGKSTLLQLLCGTLDPTAGSVEIKARVAALLELGSGFNPEFSGRENVYVYASVFGLSREEIDARLPAILEFADIGDFIDMPIKTYSSGMVVRLAFSVVAHVDAAILIIDEALAVGDAFFVQKCMRFLRNFMESGTILFVSHDTGAVVNLCERAIWLQDGQVRTIGRAKEVTESYLAALYETQQGASVVSPETNIRAAGTSDPATSGDQRLIYLNHSRFRNDIELFDFDPRGLSFGKAGATIVDVELQDSEGRRLSWCVGGEEVALRVRCRASIDVFSPIIGFQVKDRLGQILFGDNTYLTYRHQPLSVSAGDHLECSFRFRMPILKVGDYSVCVAIAEGTPEEHVQHHWMHDAVTFKSHASSARAGLVGIPMSNIELRKL
jgi:lipopolysaccharide transport system ATP-binding protein